MTRYDRFSIPMMVWAWGPVLALMALLFVSSAQPKIEQPEAGAIYFSGMMPIFPHGWDFVVKKSGHILAYGALAALMLRGWLIVLPSPRAAVMLALAFTMGYALTDEAHQSFIRGRHASAIDLGFDFVGAALAVLILRYASAHRGNLHRLAVGQLARQRR